MRGPGGALVLQEVGTAGAPGGEADTATGCTAGEEDRQRLLLHLASHRRQIGGAGPLSAYRLRAHYRAGTEEALHHQGGPDRGSDAAAFGGDQHDRSGAGRGR